MAGNLTNYGISFVAPQLPDPGSTYSELHGVQLNSVLRIYFNQLDAALRELAGQARPTIFSVTADTTLPDIRYLLVVCTNTTAITLTLDDTPTDRYQAIIKRAGTGQVTIDGNGKNIDGSSTLILANQYDAPNLVFTTDAGEWSIV